MIFIFKSISISQLFRSCYSSIKTKKWHLPTRTLALLPDPRLCHRANPVSVSRVSRRVSAMVWSSLRSPIWALVPSTAWTLSRRRIAMVKSTTWRSSTLRSGQRTRMSQRIALSCTTVRRLRSSTTPPVVTTLCLVGAMPSVRRTGMVSGPRTIRVTTSGSGGLKPRSRMLIWTGGRPCLPSDPGGLPQSR